MRQDEWIIKENILQIRQLMSDQNLQLLPDYQQRIAVLQDLEFIDDNSRVLLKGKVACEVRLTLTVVYFFSGPTLTFRNPDTLRRRARSHGADPRERPCGVPT
jgi:hypothetical protein